MKGFEGAEIKLWSRGNITLTLHNFLQ